MLLSIFFLPSPRNLVVSFLCLEVYCPEKVQFFLLWYSCIRKCQGSHYSRKTWKIRGKSAKEKKNRGNLENSGKFPGKSKHSVKTQGKFLEFFSIWYYDDVWFIIWSYLVIYTPFFTFQKFLLKKVNGITFFPLKKIFLIIRGKYILFLFELRKKVLENNKNLRKIQGKVKYKTAVIPECTINILNWMFFFCRCCW